MIRELPKEELPRERLMKYGVGALSNEELLSIILRTGTKNKSVKDLSIELLKEYDLKELVNSSYNSIAKVKGIGSVKAVTLLASLELGKRAFIDNRDIIYIRNSDDVYNYVKKRRDCIEPINPFIIQLKKFQNLLIKNNYDYEKIIVNTRTK